MHKSTIFKPVIEECPNVDMFWNTYDMLNAELALSECGHERLNHSVDPDFIAIRYREFLRHCKRRGISVHTQIRGLLILSQRYLFVDYKAVSSRWELNKVTCLVFRKYGGTAFPTHPNEDFNNEQ